MSQTNPEADVNPWAARYIDLLNEKYGGQALSCSDDFFATKDNLVKNSKPIFIEDKYTNHGKWMDGWESRRRRDGGYDWCILRMGLPGKLHAIAVDTTHFKGNAPASVSIEACFSKQDPNESTQWTQIRANSLIRPDRLNILEIYSEQVWTHLRLNIFPDGGVARLRAYGEPWLDWSHLLPGELVDLAASVNAGQALACSDMFFSSMNNLLAPGRAANMGDGWETKRRRGTGYDWAIIKLGSKGVIKKIEVDTNHFKGNYPDQFSLEATCTDKDDLTTYDIEWKTLIGKTKLGPNRRHFYQDEISDRDTAFTHVRLNIYPDGGVSRLRIYGYPECNAPQDAPDEA